MDARHRLTTVFATLFLHLGADLAGPAAAQTPEFVSDINPFGLSKIDEFVSSPAFADIDGDGDQDVFVGVTAGEQPRALARARELLAFSERFPFPLFAVIGNTAVGTACYHLGQLADASDHFTRARQAWQPDLPRIQPDQKVLFLGIGALTLQQLGDPESQAWHDDLLAYASELDDPQSVAHAYTLIAPWHVWANDPNRVLELTESAFAIADKHGFTEYSALANFFGGVAQQDPLRQKEAFDILEADGVTVRGPTHRLLMARTLLEQGKYDEAATLLEQAIEAAQRNGESRHLAEIHRARAACAIAADRRADAEQALNAARSVALSQGARLFEEWANADLEKLRSG